jgi:hypothetical protein
MKKYQIMLFLALFMVSGISSANEIYIDQVGDNLDLDIVQDGSGNQFGDSTADIDLDGDDMTFSITQTGNNNDIAAVINGNTYTGTWAFTGDYNTVDLTCDSGGVNCENITLNVTTTGDTNDFTFAIGGTADADGSTIAFSVTGDNNIMNTTVDGKSVALAVTVNNSTSLATTSANGDEGVAVTIDSSGNGSTNGHSVTLNVTGGGSTYDITQSGINDNTVSATFSGDNHDVDITQSD